MTVKLELTPDIQAGLLAQAQASGLSLEAYAVSRPGLTRSRLPVSGFASYAKAWTLGGTPIKGPNRRGP